MKFLLKTNLDTTINTRSRLHSSPHCTPLSCGVPIESFTVTPNFQLRRHSTQTAPHSLTGVWPQPLHFGVSACVLVFLELATLASCGDAEPWADWEPPAHEHVVFAGRVVSYTVTTLSSATSVIGTAKILTISPHTGWTIWNTPKGY